MNRHIREHIIHFCVAFVAFATEPMIAQAQTKEVIPENFIQPLTLSNGKIAPLSQDAQYLDAAQTCQFAAEEWGWNRAACLLTTETLLLAPLEGLDNVIVDKPNDEGYVEFDDWDEESEEAIDAIWAGYVEGAKEQGKRLGETITPLEWLIRPTLDKSRSYLVYAIALDWNGERVVNAEASLFDRYGYVTFSFVPDDSNISAAELRHLVTALLASYSSSPTKSYAEFRSGDKIAAAGAVGVLATLVGVKYGKTGLAAFLAVALLFLKKGGFVLFVLPLLFLRKLFRRKDTARDSLKDPFER